MKRYSREELLAVSGAEPEELADFEADGLLVANRGWRPWGRRTEWFTHEQLEVLRWLLKSRRALAASQRDRRLLVPDGR